MLLKGHDNENQILLNSSDFKGIIACIPLTKLERGLTMLSRMTREISQEEWKLQTKPHQINKFDGG